jgi:hypothetical protein
MVSFSAKSHAVLVPFWNASSPAGPDADVQESNSNAFPYQQLT